LQTALITNSSALFEEIAYKSASKIMAALYVWAD